MPTNALPRLAGVAIEISGLTRVSENVCVWLNIPAVAVT